MRRVAEAIQALDLKVAGRGRWAVLPHGIPRQPRNGTGKFDVVIDRQQKDTDLFHNWALASGAAYDRQPPGFSECTASVLAAAMG